MISVWIAYCVLVKRWVVWALQCESLMNYSSCEQLLLAKLTNVLITGISFSALNTGSSLSYVYSLIYSYTLPFKCINLQCVICSTHFTITQQFSFSYSRVVFSVQSQKTSGRRWKLRPKAVLQRILCGVLVSFYCISQMSFPCSCFFFYFL